MEIKIKGLVDEDFVNYRKPSMYIIFPFCDFKCDKECNSKVCQNGTLANSPLINVTTNEIVNRYLKNEITSSVVVGGLEPLDSFDSLFELISDFRRLTNDDIVIYTGYYLEEKTDLINKLKCFKNIYIKFGRYIPNQEKHYDKVLGISLASDNQYGVKLS